MSLLQVDPSEDFAQAYNRRAFSFGHTLTDSMLAQPEAVAALAARLPAGSARWAPPPTGVGDPRWEERPERRELGRVLSDLSRSNSLVMLDHIEQDREAGALCDALTAEIIDLVGHDLQADIHKVRCRLLLASPGRIASYRIDGTCNYLLQVSGHQQVYLYDAADRTLLTPEELEAFYAGRPVNAQFKPKRMGDGQVFGFRPGDGVHIPVTAPHWSHSGGQVSVALNIGFDLRSCARQAAIYRFNERLRRLGLSPRPPGDSPLRDVAKLAIMRSIDAPARALRRA